MIRYLRHSEIDRGKWDSCIRTSENGLIYAYSWYLDIIHPGWEALVKDEYAAVMPLTGGRKFGVSYLFQPFFAQQLGVFSTDCMNLKDNEFINAIPAKFRFVEIRLNALNALPPTAKGVGNHADFLLFLDAPYGFLRNRYHTNTKRNLAKAENNRLHLVKNVDIETVIDLFRANRGASVTHWGDAEYARLQHLANEAMQRNHAFIYGVTVPDSDEIVCGALFMRNNGRIIFLFSGCNEKGKSLQAMTFLLDSVIREYSNQQCALDFEGSDNANLARFYEGFGSENFAYQSFSVNRMSFLGRFLLRCWKKI